MKRTLALLLALVMALTLFSGCSRKEPPAETEPPEESAAPTDAAVSPDYDPADVTPAMWKVTDSAGHTMYLFGTIHVGDKRSETAMEKIMDAIKAIRARRAEMGVAPSRKAELTIATADAEVFTKGVPSLQRLAFTTQVHIAPEAPASLEGLVSLVTADAKLYIPLSELVDVEAERKRLEKALEKKEKYRDSIVKKLGNEKFTAKAPEAVIQRERDNLSKAEREVAQLKESLAALQ
jgi:valyl-tRNA synthetase